MKSKTILMILNQRFLPDIRVEKEYRVLKNAGYRVIVLASEDGRSTEEYEIIRLKSVKGITGELYKKLLILNNSIVKEIKTELEKRNIMKIDFIHVHDLLWGYLGVNLCSYYDSKLILDFHENYPEAIQEWNKVNRKTVKGAIKSLFINKNKFLKYEIEMVRKCDKLITVVPEAIERFKKTPNYDKGVIVSNTEKPEDWEYRPLSTESRKIVISYVGGVGTHRGIDTVIKGMKYLDRDKYELNIVGVNKVIPYTKELIKLCENNDLFNVNFIEWIPFEKVSEYIYNSHICLVPHNNCGHAQTTIPHKLFQYMAMGRAVLVSSVRPLKRIIEDTNSGMVFEADNPEDFSKKVIEMTNIDTLNTFGINGRKAVVGKYNWKQDAERLLKMYEDLSGGKEQ